MKLSTDQIINNYNKFISIVDKFEDRSEQLKKMYEALGEERVASAPASGRDYYHNAFPGGYVDHVLRVVQFSIKFYDLYKDLGLDVSNFSKTELIFAAMHHDLGKLGFPGEGREVYEHCTSEWHRKNQGKIYEINPKNPFALTPDKSLFLLQAYNIPVSWNEYLSIRVHDGLYDDSNKSYFVSYNMESKMRTNMPVILHKADLAASRYEFERWNLKSKKLDMSEIKI